MTRAPFNISYRTMGFTMVELAVVIVIIGVLLGVVLTPLATRIQMQQVRDQQRALEEIRDALLGFAQARGRLPCPDSSGNGVEDLPCLGAGTPAVASNELPYATLGVSSTDRWGHRYKYAVTSEMTNVVQTGQPAAANDGKLDLEDSGGVTLAERLDDKTLRTISSDAAAVVVSLGNNGLGGVDLEGNALPAPTGADEIENSNDDDSFITRIRTGGGSGCSDTVAGVPYCEFDDLVVIIPTPLLLGRLVQAGRLP